MESEENCMSKKADDLTGMKFGRLTVTKRVPKPEEAKGHDIYWECKCDCGKITTVRARSLKYGDSKSCGCIVKEKAAKRAIDLTGIRFGRLKVIERAGSDKYKKPMWKCKCDCGNEIIALGNCLKLGSIQSCGCLRKELAAKSATKNIEKAHKKIDGVAICQINRKISSNSKTGINGVTYSKRDKKYCASMRYAGKSFSLGSFSDLESAIAARKEAEELLYKPLLNQ